jgi:tetratricopeptide (TPR) repeat protein
MKLILDESLPFNTGDRESASEPDALDAINLSNELGKAGNFDDALAVLDKAIGKGEQNPYLYYNAGHWLSIQANFDEACLCLRNHCYWTIRAAPYFVPMRTLWRDQDAKLKQLLLTNEH